MCCATSKVVHLGCAELTCCLFRIIETYYPNLKHLIQLKVQDYRRSSVASSVVYGKFPAHSRLTTCDISQSFDCSNLPTVLVEVRPGTHFSWTPLRRKDKKHKALIGRSKSVVRQRIELEDTEVTTYDSLSYSQTLGLFKGCSATQEKFCKIAHFVHVFFPWEQSYLVWCWRWRSVLLQRCCSYFGVFETLLT